MLHVFFYVGPFLKIKAPSSSICDVENYFVTKTIKGVDTAVEYIF